MACSELQKPLDDVVDFSESCNDNDADVGTSETAMTSSSPYHAHVREYSKLIHAFAS